MIETKNSHTRFGKFRNTFEWIRRYWDIGLNSLKKAVIFPNSLTFGRGGRGVPRVKVFSLNKLHFPNSTLFTPFSCTESPIQLNRVQSIMSKQQQQLRYCKLIQLGRSIPDLSFNTKVSIISKKGSRITKNCDPRNPPLILAEGEGVPVMLSPDTTAEITISSVSFLTTSVFRNQLFHLFR